MRYIKCADCDHRYCEFCIAGDKYQKKAKSNAVTNFDRIKAMSVEEMAEFLSEVHSNGWCMGANDDNDHIKWDKEWLESEVQEDEI